MAEQVVSWVQKMLRHKSANKSQGNQKIADKKEPKLPLIMNFSAIIQEFNV
jgi:hypothetical protein